MALFFALFLALLGLTTAQSNNTCPFGPGTCPLELDNIVEVFDHSPEDFYSCQMECMNIYECNYWTLRTTDEAGLFNKCFLFKTCDRLEPCPDCITGPTNPPIGPCLGTNTCETSFDNIIDVDYYDPTDEFSCRLQCQADPLCFFWTQYHGFDESIQEIHHKCFLFKNCDVQEICPYPECESGSIEGK